MTNSKEFRRVIALPTTRAAVGALPGLQVGEDDGAFADALARLKEADNRRPQSIWQDKSARR